MKKAIYFLLLFFYSTAGAQGYEVKVHPGTELLHIINYLAGVNEPLVQESSYLEAVDDWFVSYKEHPAVQHASQLPYNDFADLGWCFDLDNQALHYPEDYGYFAYMLDTAFLKTYLTLSKAFAEETRFWDFFLEQEANYQQWEAQFSTALVKSKNFDQLEDFYRVPLNKTIYFSISPIGTTLKANLYLEAVNPKYAHYAPIIIPYDHNMINSESKSPNFKYNEKSLRHSVWHEASHLYWEVINEKYRKQLSQLRYKDAYSQNFNSFDDNALNQYFFIHELIADGVAISMKHHYVEPALAEEHLQLNEKMGAVLFRDLHELLKNKYWENRHEVNFQDFIPEIIAMIEAKKQS